ncbi:aminoglycoside phosphotransferase family protein [Streptomyces koyangensis]|uniref:aminoglycoside phosphotransferase family protein n=1 Tax=Streptomyces koyangensis TaxID=188770 RepID=UPI003C2E4080
MASKETEVADVADQEVLTGGVNEVTRVADRVRRPAGPWTPLVHDVLRHVRERGFTGAPEVHGMTEDGQEELSFLPGQVSNYPVTAEAASTEALVTAARLLRGYHDAVADFPWAGREGWMLPAQPGADLVCHGDFGPHNCVLDGTRAVGLIDFDTAHPATRLWDVAYAVYRWAPVTAPGNTEQERSVREQAERTRLFCDSYGLPADDRPRLLDTMADRLNALVAFMRGRAAEGDTAFQSHLDAGHHHLYLGDVEYIRASKEEFHRVLLTG